MLSLEKYTLVINIMLLMQATQGLLWRYHTHFGDRGYLQVNENLELEYLGASASITWSVDADKCSFSDHVKGLKWKTLRCLKPGMVKLTIADHQDSIEKLLYFLHKPGCYIWQMAFAKNQDARVAADDSEVQDLPDGSEFVCQVPMEEEWVSGDGSLRSDHTALDYSIRDDMFEQHKQVHIYVWVMDPNTASEAELKGTATQPSKSSKLLTRQFHILGQEPRITLPAYDMLQVFPLIRRDTFDEHIGAWKYTIQMSMASRRHFLISGKPIALFSCLVSDSELLMPAPYLTLNQTYSTRFVVQNFNITIIKDPLQNSAILLSGEKMWFTNDGFAETSLMNLTFSHTDLQTDIQLQDICFTASGLVILTQHKLCVLDKFTGDLQYVPGLPDASTLRGVSSRTTLFVHVMERAEYDICLTWSEDRLFLVSSPAIDRVWSVGHTWNITDILTNKAINFTQMEIQDAKFQHTVGKLGVVVKITQDDQDRIIMLHIDSTNDVYHLDELGSLALDYDSIKVDFVSGNTLSYIVWSDTGAYYNLLQGSVKGYYSKSDGNSLLSPSEYIRQHIMSQNGDIVILTSSNAILYGQPNVPLIQLQQWEESDLPSAIFMDSIDNLYVLTIDGTSINRHCYPLKHEVAMYSNSSCQFLFLSHNVDKAIYNIDVGEEITFWMKLIYHQNTPNPILVSAPDLDYINVTEEIKYEYGSGLVAETRTISLKHNVDMSTVNFEAAKDEQTTMFTVEMEPTFKDLMCPKPTKLIAQVYVGCQKGKLIFIRGYDTSCDNVPPAYTLFAGQYQDEEGNLATASKVVQYDQDKLGCPITFHYEKVFTPILEVYKYGQLLGSVQGNFVVWEEHGRTGLSYSATMRDVGCIREAQTWENMTQTPGWSKDKTWAVGDYVSCFSGEPTEDQDLYKPYQILNGTGVSGLTFDGLMGDDLGIYILNFKVIDPNESYCTLTVQVAVQIYGDAVDLHDQLLPLAASVIGFFSLVSLILILSYLYYCLFASHLWKPEIYEELEAITKRQTDD